MSLTSLLRHNKEFRAVIDAGIPSGWLKAFRAQIPSDEPQDSPPEVLNHTERGLLCDFAIRKLLRDGEVHVQLLPWSETRMLESVAGADVRVPGDRSYHGPLLGVHAPSDALLTEADAWLKAYLARPLPKCLVETIMLSYPEMLYRSGRWDATLSDLIRKQALLHKNRAAIWAWLKPTLTWARDALAGSHRAVLAPSFGKASGMVGGADCDLWIDGYLLDMKYVRRVKKLDYIRQLVGYAMLARIEGGFWRDNLCGIGVILPRQRAIVRTALPPGLEKASQQMVEWLARLKR